MTLMRRYSATFLIVGCIGALFATARADAQIYSWRDDSGTLVLSDVPRSSGMQTVAVAATNRIRTTRPIAPGGRPDQYDRLIQRHARRIGVHPDLVRAVVQVESGFDPEAVSPAGAMGLMQLMPQTAHELRVDDPFDPDQNLQGGVTYLKQLLTRYDGNEELALAAYNAGPGSVSRFGNQVPPFPETLGYVAKVRASSGPGAPRTGGHAGGTIYKGHEIIDGRRVPLYTDTPPSSGDFRVAASEPER